MMELELRLTCRRNHRKNKGRRGRRKERVVRSKREKSPASRRGQQIRIRRRGQQLRRPTTPAPTSDVGYASEDVRSTPPKRQRRRRNGEGGD
jgi:hypothetical protein